MSGKFTVDFYYKKPSDKGKGTRSTLKGNVGQALQGAESETAVQQYLKAKYRGADITIMKLTFSK